jgi:hypothetical protein
MLTHVIRHWTPPLHLGGLRCWHTTYGTLWALGSENKERLTYNARVAGLVCYQGTHVCYQIVCKTCGQMAL